MQDLRPLGMPFFAAWLKKLSELLQEKHDFHGLKNVGILLGTWSKVGRRP
jgi:hypothetical protein